MNNKNKPALSKAEGLIPDLRFPEFLNEGEWEEKTIGEVYDFKITNSFSREYLNYEKGYLKNIHYGDIHTKFNTLFDITKERVPFINQDVSIDKIKEENYCLEGDMVFADASEDLNDVGKSIELINLNNEKLVSGLHTLLARQKEPILAIGFGGYLFKSDRIRKQIQREAQGAKVLGISASRIANIKIFYSKNPQEQQKIADCLSSLDEVIAAHSQKLALLKDHKKGLMQNLFPQEGEKVPKYRFKEFEEDGEWEEKTVGEIFNSFSGGTPTTSEKKYYGGKIPFIRSAEIDREKTELFLTEEGLKNSSAKLVNKGDLLVALYGANSGDSAISKINGAINQAILCLQSEYSNAFTYNFLALKKDWIVSRFIQGGQGNLSGDIVKSIAIPFPKKQEQQKIASCLTSLDALISAQAEKIAQLKLHKKGLMQGLFPKMSESPI